MGDTLTEVREKYENALDSLRKQDEVHRLIVENTLDIIWQMNTTLEFTFVNQAVARLLGYEPQEFIGTALADHCSPEQFRAVRAYIDEHIDVADERTTFVIEAELLHCSGTSVPLEVHGSVLFDADGNIIGYLGVSRDISERKRMEAQLMQSQRLEALGRLAGGIAHDFNNVLGGINGYVDLLKLKTENERPDLLDYALKITDITARSADLVRKLLTFARCTDITEEPLDIHECVNQVMDMFGRTVGRRITIDCRCDAAQSVVNGDRGELESMLLNIAINARDAMNDGGKLHVTTTDTCLDRTFFDHYGLSPRPGDYLRISFADTGRGMSEEVRRRIFEPFFTTKGPDEGTGLGLSSAFGIVKRHGGYIFCESEPGRGTVFSIYLPSAPMEPQQERNDAGEESGTRGMVMVVDDEELVCDSVAEMLSCYQFETRGFTDTTAAFEWFREHGEEVDLVLVDLFLPQMSGIDCFRELQKMHPHTTAIATSGYGRAEEKKRAIDAGMAAFIEKPFQISHLVQVIEENIVKNRGTREHP